MGVSQPKLFQNCEVNAQRTIGALEDILWCCRACGSGWVTLSTAWVLLQETPTSMGGRLGEGTWDPTMTSERFVAIAVCDSCKDPTSLAGETRTRPSPEDNPGRGWTTYLAPQFVYPPPFLVRRPKCLPTSIEDVLTRAEGLVWSDLGSASKGIGDVIDEVLTEWGIQSTEVNDYGSADTPRRVASAPGHSRQGLTLADLLDGFKLLDELIDDVYGLER
jgi:hypothetical protein